MLAEKPYLLADCRFTPMNLALYGSLQRKDEHSLAVQEAKGFEKVFPRVEEFLEGRHPQEKALAIFAGQNSWTVLSLETAVQDEIHWVKPAVGQLVRLFGE